MMTAVLAGLVYLVAGAAVFFFESTYFNLFWTNKSKIYRFSLPVVSVLAVLFSSSLGLSREGRLLAVGFTVASLANAMG